ncbi:MAG: phage tail length tape measure family protein [Thalassotalea sp.]|nr:phage tail length tape measure family protein [Thalassotalea sp.]
MTKRYDVELRGNTKNHRAEFGKSIKTNEKFAKSLKGVAQGTAAIDGPLGGVASRISVMNSLFTTGNLALAGFGAGIAALGMAAVQSLKVFDQYEKQQLRTEALVKATGSAAGFTAEQLAKQADEVALNTLASVAGIVEAQNVLQTFKTVSGETFKQAIRLSQDMAATFGGSARDKALQLGKALEDPTTGLNALRRSGVSFTESEKDMIKAMQEAGDLAGAQTLILKKLEEQIGGAGSAEAGGLSGAVDTLGQRWDELMLSFSETSGLGEGVTYVINRIARGMGKFTDKINGNIDRTERLKQLWDEYAKIEEKLGKGRVRNRNGLLNRQKEIREEVDLLNKKTIAEGEAYKKAALNQKKIQDDLLAEQAKKEKEQADKKAAKLAADQARQDEANQQAIDRFKNHNQRIYEESLAAQNREIDLEDARYKNRVQQLEKEYELLKEKGLVTAEIDAEKKAALEELEIAHLARLSDINKTHNQELIESEKEKNAVMIQGYSSLLSIVGSYYDGMEGKQAGYARVAISIGQTLLDEEKRKSITSIWSTTYDTAMKAYNSMAAIPVVGPVLGGAAAGVVIAAGTAYAAKVSGLASFDGGGYTGDIPRYGGLDGKGGFLAMLHGNETIVDHTKGQQLAQQTTQNVSVNYHFGSNAQENERMLNNNRNATIRDARRLSEELGRPY